MGFYRRITDVPRRALAVGVNGPFNLGVNPISFTTLHIDGLVAAATAVGVDQPFTDIDNVRVTFNGAGVLDLRGEDIRAALMALGWRVPYVLNHNSVTNGDVVRCSIPLPFSRKPFWLREAFPATRSGELQISITMAAEGATFTTRNITIESTQILDANPERFIKMVQNSRALVAGDEDFELPKGNDYVGILIREPATMDAGAATGTIRDMKLLVDEVEFGVATSRFEAMRDFFEQAGGGPVDMFAFQALPHLGGYGFIPFDPLMDDSYLLPTIGRSSVKLRPTLDNAGTVRVVPIELVKVEPLQPAGA